MACWRLGLLLLAGSLATTLACTTETPTPANIGNPDDASVTVVDEGGSPAACENAGGMCVTFQTGCPILQQNTVLCGDSVMICCLPPDDAAPFVPPVEAGVETGSPGPEAGGAEASPDGAGD
ncbi:MAG TPA: hypothetical protein VHS09_04855 [Polyangiaceae bacterium]|jgi:hypothetical protein|nr:hypothetical protein [Polyangiaceae bacterium]